MAKLTFTTSELSALLADAMRAWKADKQVRTYCGQYNEPGLWLVGDEGIYLMHNGKTHVRMNGSTPRGDAAFDPDNDNGGLAVVYAQECDPRKGDCWDSKRRLFGADDGVELIPEKTARAWISSLLAVDAKTGQIEIARDSVRVVLPKPTTTN